MNFVTVKNYHFYHLFLLQIHEIQQIIRMSLFMKFEPLFLPLLKIIGKEHDFLQNFPYILSRIMHETIFNQKQGLQGTIFIIYSYHFAYCKYNKLYVRQVLWSLNHYFQSYCNFWIFRGLFQTQIFTCRSDFLHLFAGYFFWWNGDLEIGVIVDGLGKNLWIWTWGVLIC